MVLINQYIDKFKEIYDKLKGKNKAFDEWIYSLGHLTNVVDEVAPPKWYSSRLSKSEMGRRGGISHERVRQIIKKRHLQEPNPPRKSEMNPVNIPSWYDPNKTTTEMALKAKKSRACVYSTLKKKGLPFKLCSTIIFEIYDANKTVKEMFQDERCRYKNMPALRSVLSKYNLPYKHRELTFNKGRKSIKDVYRPNKSIKEMADEAKVSRVSVFIYLKRHNLPFKRIRAKEESKKNTKG